MHEIRRGTSDTNAPRIARPIGRRHGRLPALAGIHLPTGSQRAAPWHAKLIRDRHISALITSDWPSSLQGAAAPSSQAPLARRARLTGGP